MFASCALTSLRAVGPARPVPYARLKEIGVSLSEPHTNRNAVQYPAGI